MLDALERLRADVAAGAFVPGAGRRGRAHRARARADRAGGRRPRRQAARRPLAQRPDRHARADVPARRRRACSAGSCSTSSTRSSTQADRRRRRADARAHAPAARPAGAARAPPAGARVAAAARRRALGRLGRARGRGRRTARVRSPARRSASTRPRSPPSSGFDGPVENSIDGTASRDVVAEFAFVAAMLGVDLSRLAEEVILWATKEFGFVAPATTPTRRGRASCRRRRTRTSPSSRAARPAGSSATSTGLLTTLKGLPLAYNRDLQEDKEPVFDQVDTLTVLLPAFAGMVATLTFDTDADGRARPAGLLARDRHRGVAGPRRACRSGSRTRSPARACGRARSTPAIELWDLTDDELAAISAAPDPGGARRCSPSRARCASRSAHGGTAPVRVAEQLEPGRAAARRAELRALAPDGRR